MKLLATTYLFIDISIAYLFRFYGLSLSQPTPKKVPQQELSSYSRGALIILLTMRRIKHIGCTNIVHHGNESDLITSRSGTSQKTVSLSQINYLYMISNDSILILLNLHLLSNRPQLCFSVFQLNENWFIGITEELKRDFFKRIFASCSQINSLGSVFFRFFIYLLISLKNTILFSKKDNIFTS